MATHPCQSCNEKPPRTETSQSLGDLLIILTTVKLLLVANLSHLCYTLSLLLPADVKISLFSLLPAVFAETYQRMSEDFFHM